MYTISEVSERTQLTHATLRFYEKELLIDVDQDAAGQRTYSEDALDLIENIQLLKLCGCSLKEIREFFQKDTKVQLILLQQYKQNLSFEKKKIKNAQKIIISKINKLRKKSRTFE